MAIEFNYVIMPFCTTAQVKAHANIPGSSFDAVFDQLIPQVDEMITQKTGVATDNQTFTNEIVDSDGDLEIQVCHHPISGLTKIEYRDANNDWLEYTNEAIGDVEYEGDMIYTEYVVAAKGRRRIRLTYDAGYNTADVPKDLQLAAILMVLRLFTERNSVGLSSNDSLGLKIVLSQKDHDYVDKILKKYSQIYAL